MKSVVKNLILTIFIFLLNKNLQASSCTPYGTDVTLTRQSEIDSFPINYPGCDVVEGSLTISGNDIVNLNGLSSLNYIRYLEIKYNSNLTNLNGLNNLDSSEIIKIDSNFSLISLYGLNSLRFCQDLEIKYNVLLKNLTGLDRLETIKRSIVLNENISMKDLQGLFKIKYIGHLNVYNNDSILDLNGLNTLFNIQTIQIHENHSITNLNGLNNIKILTDYNYIANNSNLISLDGLNNLDSVDMLGIINNSKLENINALHKLKKVSNIFYITYNDSLKNLSGLELLKYAYHISLIGNESLKDLKGLSALSEVSSMNVAENTSLQNLDGLQSLNKVGLYLNVFNNQTLNSLNGLNPLVLIKNKFEVYNNPILRCCLLAKAIINNNPTATITISNNDIGCSSVPEVIALTPSSTCCIPTLNKDTIQICQGTIYKVGTHIYSTAGIYKDTFHIAAGCDSIIITNLIVRPKSYQILPKNLCIGQSFTLSNGKVITTNGIYKDTIPNVCDSIIEYRLTFLNNINTSVNASICKGKAYTLPKGNIVSTSGVYKDTLLASFGCDSIITTNLTITNPIPFNNNVTICIGKSYTLPNGNIVKTAGIYRDTITKPNICDSIIITNLTVNPYLQSTQAVSICLGKSYTLPNGRSVNQTGIYKDTTQNSNGCDSIITTNLIVNNPVANHINVSICEGQTYTLPNGKQVNFTGVYTDTIKKINTCDSVVITHLDVFPNTFNISLHPIDTIDVGNSITLNPLYTNQHAISWNWISTSSLSCTTCENPIATPSQTTIYTVNAKAFDGCEDSATTTIAVRQTEIYMPNAFSPNNDGINDYLDVFAVNLKNFSLKIYNRYGELVFQSNDVQIKWNGMHKGENCAVDNYNFVLDATQQNGKKIHQQGVVLLVR